MTASDLVDGSVAGGSAGGSIGGVRRTALACGASVALIAFVFGAVGIGRSFGYDEGFTYVAFVNGGSLRRALTTQWVFNNHQMFSAIQALWWRLGFVGESAQRVLPVAAGAMTVGLVGWYTARRVGVVAGATAGLVLTFNPIYLEQVRQLRGYALATLSVLVAGMAIQRSWNDERRRWLVIQGVAMVVAVTTHSYSAVTILMFAAAALAMGRVRRAHLVTWAVSAAVALLIQFPLLDDARRNAELRGSAYRDWFGEFTLRAFVGYEWPAVAVVGSLGLTGVITLALRSRRHLYGVLAAGAVFAVAFLLLWQVVRPYDLYPRFFISAVPVVACLVGLGVGTVVTSVRPPAGNVIAAAIGLAAVATLLPSALDIVRSPDSGYREAAAVVTEARRLGLEPCGSHTEPLAAYAEPLPLVTGIGDIDDCDLFVATLGVRGAQRASLEDRFDGAFRVGSVGIWTDGSLVELLRPADG